MTLFRVNPEKPFQGPHHGQPVSKAGAPPSRAKAGMIILHGRGAVAKNMLWLIDEFAQPDVRYLVPQADTHTWYPYPFTAAIDKNQPHLSSALQTVHELIEQLIEEGIPKHKVILLGFSQGACLALEYAARHPQKFGGIVGLSGGLIGPNLNPGDYTGDLEGSRVFIGSGDNDEYLPVNRLSQTAEIMNQIGGVTTKRTYPDTGHEIVEDEIKFVRGLVASIIHN